jgi:hypothetical protein
MQPNEQVISYTVDYSMSFVYAIVGVFNENHKVISNRSVNLGSEGFAMLMEEKPSWSPKKPKDNFYMEDLIAVINILDTEQ